MNRSLRAEDIARAAQSIGGFEDERPFRTGCVQRPVFAVAAVQALDRKRL